MKNVNLSKLLFLLISFTVLVVSYKQLKNFQIQYNLLNEFNQNKLTKSTFEKIKDEPLNFPNLGVTVIPLKAMKSEYLFQEGEYDQAINLLYNSIEENPYLGFNEHKLSLIYDRLNIKDSFYHYAKRAFYKIPNNGAHWGYYVKAMNSMNYTDSIVKEFKKVENSNNQLVWSYFFGGLINKKGNDSILKIYANKAKNKFIKPSKELKSFIEISLYGQNNVKKADSMFNLANDLSNNNKFSDAFILFNQAIEYYPNKYEYYQNFALTYAKADSLIQAERILKKAIENVNPSNGKPEYYLGLIYLKQGKDKLACELLSKSSILGNKESTSMQKSVCLK